MEFVLWAATYIAIAVASAYLFTQIRWIRASRPKLAPAPPLNPKWDVTKCPHAIIEPVIPSGETETVSWICLNPECYAQLELGDPSVARRHRQARISEGWEDVQELNQGARFIAGSITSDNVIISADGVEIRRYAQQVNEARSDVSDLVRKVHIPVVPDLTDLVRHWKDVQTK